MNDHTRLNGLAALVTGGGRGVGKGISLALARAGCKVAVNYYTEPELAEQTVAEIQALGGDAFPVKADVSSRVAVEELFDRVSSHFSGLDILVNNAGVQIWKGLLDLTEEEWDFVLDTNLKGCFLCTQLAARHMRNRGGGSIVNIGSGCNKLAFPKLVSYTASKGGIEMFTKVAAVELGPFGIRVNCVAPGAIEIERTKLEDLNYAATWAAITPLRRVGSPSDVGEAVVFLAGRESTFISGQTLWVDGGLFAQPQWPYQQLTAESSATSNGSSFSTARGEGPAKVISDEMP